MKIVFYFQNKPTNNFLGTDGSSDAITLFDNGIIRYEHFLFCCEEPDQIKEHGPFEELPAIVLNIIAEYANEIETFPAFIINHCDDGARQYFQLGEKRITVDNMMYTSADDIQTIHLLHDGDELAKIMLSIKQTNTMVEIYRRISSALFEHCHDKLAIL